MPDSGTSYCLEICFLQFGYDLVFTELKILLM